MCAQVPAAPEEEGQALSTSLSIRPASEYRVRIRGKREEEAFYHWPAWTLESEWSDEASLIVRVRVRSRVGLYQSSPQCGCPAALRRVRLHVCQLRVGGKVARCGGAGPFDASSLS